tara:strand:- start:13 stop:327 length:315 start_codon:yes stop_codon:yes gene_type:complete
MILEVTENTVNDLLTKEGITILDFYADWCGPCKMYTPILEEFANENDNITIGKVNVDSNQELALKYGIRSIPTTIVFKDGEKNGNNISGLVQKNKLEEIVNSLS